MSFADAWAAASDVEGWLTEAQARRLFVAAAAVPARGRIVEIGSFRGRSAIVLARAATARGARAATWPSCRGSRRTWSARG
jgi:predicted O-methyltransferase YrrM